MRKCVSFSMAAILAMTATLSAMQTSTAGVFPVDTVTSQAAAPQDIVEVHYRGGGAVFAGMALGLFGAAIAGNSYYYGPRYYYPSYYPYYGYPSYNPGYYYPPYSYYRPYNWGYRYPRYRYYRRW
jgi:hypothetical protein